MAEKITCTACGGRTVQGAFCEKCGHAMAERELPAGTGEKTSGDSGTTPAPSAGLAAESTEPPQPSAVAPEEITPKSIVFCQELKVEYNMAALFVVGINMPFAFRITPLVDGLEHIVVSIQAETDGREWHHTKRLTQRPLKGKPFDYRTNFRPREGFGGVISFEVYICYEKNDQTYAFETSTRHKVYPQQSNARDVMDTIIVNINNEINTGHAADISLRNGLNELQSLRNNTSENETLQNLVNQFYDIPAVFCSLPFYPSSCTLPQSGGRKTTGVDGKSSPPDTARVTRATLRVGRRLVHLFADDRLSLGRSRDNDLVTRNFNQSVVAQHDRNLSISRYHCRLELHGDRCFVIDGGFDPDKGTVKASASGTFLDGEPLPPGDYREATAGTTALLNLAGVPGVMAFKIRTIPCSRAGEEQCPINRECEEGMVSGVYLERASDDAPESYVLLARCADLGDLLPTLRGLVAWRCDDGISYSTGTNCGPLNPGETLTVNGRSVAVEHYRQWGL